MTRSVTADRRGISLVLVLAATVLAGSIALVALHAAVIRARLVADSRWRIEGTLIAATALAHFRLAHRGDLDTLADGGDVIAARARSDIWTWRAEALRTGSVIRIAVVAMRQAADGATYAARHASLLLVRDPADTVRVIASRARF